MIGELRAASSLIGRRATLKYLCLGAVAAATAACGGRDTPSDRPTVAALAVEAFAKGTWKVTSTVTRAGYDRPSVLAGELTVGDGKWQAGPGLIFETYEAGGEYTLTGDELRVVQRGSAEYRRKYPQVKDLVFAGSGIPAQVPVGSFILGWSLEQREQTCDTQWDGRTLTIVGNDFYENPTVVTATRR